MVVVTVELAVQLALLVVVVVALVDSEFQEQQQH
jgi:hypothetical protein